MKSLKHICTVLLLVTFGVVSGIPGYMNYAEAGMAPVPGQLVPFGGMVLLNWPCTCSVPPGFALVVGPPTPTSAVFAPAYSRLYMHYMPFMGAWVLGQEEPGDCYYYVGKFCVWFPSKGLIYHIGTSIPGADLIDV